MVNYFAHAVSHNGLDIEPRDLKRINWTRHGTEDFLGHQRMPGADTDKPINRNCNCYQP
jgi:hypothetical protein